MWNLNSLDVADYREHLDIAFPPGIMPEQISVQEKDLVLQFYRLYQQELGRPSVELLGDDTPEPLRQQLHDAYSLIQDGRRLGKLRASLKLLAETCPYCGYGPIEELDHLLQRGRYKLFSIFPLNLIPSCGACNRGKRRTPPANADGHQIHVYLEDLSQYDFLRAEVTVDGATGALQARYFIAPSPDMPDELNRRLQNHLVEFDLQS
ncbi:conserved hypothetical protein, partial [Ricinus communis]